MNLNNYLRGLGGDAVMDSCNGKKCDKDKAFMDGADSYSVNDISLKAVASVQQWAESDDLDVGETSADRLMAMMVGIADSNKDGEITEDEQGIIEIALNAVWDYLAKKGVPEDDISALLNDWDEEVAERIKELLVGELPDGEEADDEMNSFVFSDQDQAPLLDSIRDAVMDATYRKKIVVRHGKKVRINKRISGTVRLSAKQKMAIRKARMKSHSASAMMRRMKSMRVRKNSNL